MPDLSKLGVTMAEATQGVPAFQAALKVAVGSAAAPNTVAQVDALAADFGVRLATAIRDMCKVVNAFAIDMAKRAPAVEEAAAHAFAVFADALPPARKESDCG